MPNEIVPVTSKPVTNELTEDTYLLVIKPNEQDQMALYRLPISVLISSLNQGGAQT